MSERSINFRETSLDPFQWLSAAEKRKLPLSCCYTRVEQIGGKLLSLPHILVLALRGFEVTIFSLTRCLRRQASWTQIDTRFWPCPVSPISTDPWLGIPWLGVKGGGLYTCTTPWRQKAHTKTALTHRWKPFSPFPAAYCWCILATSSCCLLRQLASSRCPSAVPNNFVNSIDSSV